MELQKNTAHTLQTNNTDHISYLPEASLRPADILLPDMNVDMKKWAVIACDSLPHSRSIGSGWKITCRMHRLCCGLFIRRYI